MNLYVPPPSGTSCSPQPTLRVTMAATPANSLFDGTAEYYERYRVSYPAQLSTGLSARMNSMVVATYWTGVTATNFGPDALGRIA